MTVAQLMDELKDLDQDTPIVMSHTTWRIGEGRRVIEQVEIAGVETGLNCDAEATYILKEL